MPETRWRSLCGAPGMEVGNREAIPSCRIRSLAQAMDRRKDIRLDQSQSSFGSRFRTLCHDRHGLHPPRHDPHHAKVTCCKRLVMTPIFSDGLSEVGELELHHNQIALIVMLLALLHSRDRTWQQLLHLCGLASG